MDGAAVNRKVMDTVLGFFPDSSRRYTTVNPCSGDPLVWIMDIKVSNFIKFCWVIKNSMLKIYNNYSMNLYRNTMKYSTTYYIISNTVQLKILLA